MTRLPSLLLLGLLTGGCAYYNGMYNTKRLAGSAVRAEREGRTLEANNLWGQVAVRAESVIARHPRSKWTPEARLLRGKALARLRDCTSAEAPLAQVAFGPADRKLVEEAARVLGDCRAQLGDAAGAAAVYSILLESKNPANRQIGLFQHGRALRLRGDYAEALAELAQTDDPRAPGERAAALAGLGRVPEALALCDSLLARGDTAAPWDSILDGIGRQDAITASRLLDRLLPISQLKRDTQARWLLQDGLRLGAADRELGMARLALAGQISEDFAGVEARITLLRLKLSDAADSAHIALIGGELQSAAAEGGGMAVPAAQLLGLIQRTQALVDSATPGSAQGDLRLFLAAEIARDSLAAPRFAGALLHRILAEWPESPFAPKALLALAQLEPAATDSIITVARQEYPESPYLAVLSGLDPPEFRSLEDSLALFARTMLPGPYRATEGVPPRQAPAAVPPAAGKTRRPVEPQ